MNELFKNMKSKRIQLDKEFYLSPDGFKGLVLQREVQKSRIKKDTKEIENYTDIEQWYYPNTSQTLKKYLTLSLEDSGNIEELKNNLERVETNINRIREKWNIT